MVAAACPNKNHFEHIQSTFKLDHRPANVRAGRLFARLPFIHRYQRWPIGLGLIPAEGRFTYRRAGQIQAIKFNGRNLQFHALYDRNYRYGYELETALLIAALCRDQRPFFDIGANWSCFSLLAASLPGFSGPIYAFEPNTRTFADLTATLKQADVTGHVTACQIGVGLKACEMTVTEANRFETGVSRLTADGAGAKIPVKPVDVLEFSRKDLSMLLTYDHDYAASIERFGPPRLGVVEVSARRRFLLGQHVNLLGVHGANVDGLWQAGILNFGKM